MSTRYNTLSFTVTSTLLAGLLFSVALVVLLGKPATSESQSGTAMSGYAWSETIGWISLSCTTGGPTGEDICASKNYGLAIDASGFVTGYAWSDNIGWVKFGGLSSFPAGSGTSAQDAQISTSALIGWARACAGTSTGDCTTMTSRTDGWDGWISLSGTGYGVTLSAGIFAPCQVGSTSCAWGDVNVGWIDFSNASTNYQACYTTQGNYCEPPGAGGVSKHRDANCDITIYQCQWQCEAISGLCILPPTPTVTGGGLTLSPSVVRMSGTTTVSWTVQDAQSCTVSGDNGDVSSSTPLTSSPITVPTSYVLTCTDMLGAVFTLDEETVSVAPEWEEL